MSSQDFLEQMATTGVATDVFKEIFENASFLQMQVQFSIVKFLDGGVYAYNKIRESLDKTDNHQTLKNYLLETTTSEEDEENIYKQIIKKLINKKGYIGKVIDLVLAKSKQPDVESRRDVLSIIRKVFDNDDLSEENTSKIIDDINQAGLGVQIIKVIIEKAVEDNHLSPFNLSILVQLLRITDYNRLSSFINLQTENEDFLKVLLVALYNNSNAKVPKEYNIYTHPEFDTNVLRLNKIVILKDSDEVFYYCSQVVYPDEDILEKLRKTVPSTSKIKFLFGTSYMLDNLVNHFPAPSIEDEVERIKKYKNKQRHANFQSLREMLSETGIEGKNLEVIQSSKSQANGSNNKTEALVAKMAAIGENIKLARQVNAKHSSDNSEEPKSSVNSEPSGFQKTEMILDVSRTAPSDELDKIFMVEERGNVDSIDYNLALVGLIQRIIEAGSMYAQIKVYSDEVLFKNFGEQKFSICKINFE